VSLLVKRLEQGVGLVDQLLNALTRGIVRRAIRTRNGLHDRISHCGAYRDGAYADPDPQKSTGDPAIFAIGALVSGVIEIVVGRLQEFPPRGYVATFSDGSTNTRQRTLPT
jgi:hypothetical protein